MTLSPDALTTADTLWQRLIEHQPAVVAALAMQVRALPEDWSQRVLGVARPHAALELPATDDVPMEIEPYDAADWENCPACGELDRPCRYHEGRRADMTRCRDQSSWRRRARWTVMSATISTLSGSTCSI
ncbi:hypothetical protein [Streptomyces sp. M92]|uniref:hypothetical protein n=1 Tax=Streptomyces sp. M92 TaxID=2944250 RepID=UPI00234B8D83|nr:hypothetical protein [Streptomyces sp. M92]WCN07378.1 hypothetical protein M6G08_35655 [Streptomyces sp. M92]